MTATTQNCFDVDQGLKIYDWAKEFGKWWPSEMIRLGRGVVGRCNKAMKQDPKVGSTPLFSDAQNIGPSREAGMVGAGTQGLLETTDDYALDLLCQFELRKCLRQVFLESSWQVILPARASKTAMPFSTIITREAPSRVEMVYNQHVLFSFLTRMLRRVASSHHSTAPRKPLLSHPIARFRLEFSLSLSFLPLLLLAKSAPFGIRKALSSQILA